MRGMISGEGMFLLTVQGSGLLLLSSFGAIHSKTLAPGEEYIVDTGHIVAFESSVEYRIEKATGRSQGVGGFLKGMVQSALSGEGLVCRYRGPGTIYLQTRQLPGFARALAVPSQTQLGRMRCSYAGDSSRPARSSFGSSLAKPSSASSCKTRA